MAANSVVGPAAEVTKHLEGRRPYATLQLTPVHSNTQKRSSVGKLAPVIRHKHAAHGCAQVGTCSAVRLDSPRHGPVRA
eukprot:SAG25_NODE_2236_length_1809_cov_2.170175_3_plen_79_part_00